MKSSPVKKKEEPKPQEPEKPQAIHPPLPTSYRPPFIPPFNKGLKIKQENKGKFFSRTRRGI